MSSKSEFDFRLQELLENSFGQLNDKDDIFPDKYKNAEDIRMAKIKIKGLIDRTIPFECFPAVSEDGPSQSEIDFFDAHNKTLKIVRRSFDL